MAQLTVTWTDQTAGAHRHRVYYLEQGDTNRILDTPAGVAAGTASHTLTELDSNTTYEITVTAWNQADNLESGMPAFVTATTAAEGLFPLPYRPHRAYVRL